jgi:hypothetical protein
VAHYYKTVTGGKVNFVPANETYGANDGIITVTIAGKHKNWRNQYSASGNDEKDNLLTPALEKADEYIDFSYYHTPDTKDLCCKRSNFYFNLTSAAGPLAEWFSRHS